MKLQENVANQSITENRTDNENPQSLWESFKSKMNEEVKLTAKAHMAKINVRIKQIQKTSKHHRTPRTSTHLLTNNKIKSS